MRANQVNRELRKLAGYEKENLQPDRKHMERTAVLAENACRTAMVRGKKMGFCSFVIRQIRYTGRYVWVWQALLFILILSAFEQMAGLGRLGDPAFLMFLYRRVPLLLCGAGILSAWSCVPFFARSGRWGMTEVEAAGCSLPMLRTAQFLIAGVSAVLMEAGITAAAYSLWTIEAEGLAAWLFLPFLLSWNCILLFLDRGRHRHFAAGCSAVLAAGFMAFVLVWRYVSRGAVSPRDYMDAAGSVWILCGAAALLWIFQIWKLGRKEMDRWSYV